MAPVGDLDLALGRLLHPVQEHGFKMLALSSKDRFMGVNWFLLNDENYIGESLVIYQGAHVADQTRHRLVVNLILLKSTDVQNANIIQPFAAVKASENEELLGANDTSGMSLSPCWSFFKLKGVTPVHGFCV